MAVINCPICGRIFNDNDQYAVCLSCILKYQEEFSRVRDTLYDHPEYNIVQVSEVTDVPISRLKLFLKEGRLIATNNTSSSLLACEECGQAIQTGSLCLGCEQKKNLNTKKGVYVGSKQSTKMHSRDSKPSATKIITNSRENK